jgi:dTDP-4-amino-4,6-dideoxygalactose transaminase
LSLANKVTDKTRAIVVVHIYGQPANMSAVINFAIKHNLKVIEDCAQATGASIDGKKVGTFGDVGCFSFYPTKNLGAYGDGGMIVTSNGRFAEHAKELRKYGMKENYYSHNEGFNSRLDEIQAAILNTKLPHLDAWNARRKEIADFYIKNITNKNIVLPRTRPGTNHVFHLFVVRTEYRIQLLKHLADNGVGFGIHYEHPIHLQEAYKFLKYDIDSLPQTESTAKEIVSLPIFPELTNEEILHIVETINSFSISELK